MCKEKKYKISVIISGGQTGADRGGLDFAISADIKHGGWCPLGRKAEDGIIPDKYSLKETTVILYPARTRMNIRDSDATIVFSSNLNSKGTILTTRLCQELRKPYITILIPQTNLKQYPNQEICDQILEWLKTTKPSILNIAGSRESHCPGLGKFVKQILSKILTNSKKEKEWPPKRPTTPNLPL